MIILVYRDHLSEPGLKLYVGSALGAAEVPLTTVEHNEIETLARGAIKRYDESRPEPPKIN